MRRGQAALAASAMTLSFFVVTSNNAAPPMTDPLSNLAGRWIGNAVMTSATGGSSSNFKCVVTYLPRRDGPGLQQNLRCDDGGSFKLHAATQLEFAGARVTGHWQDKINEIDGTVDGKITRDGFEIQLDGRFFAAKMAVAGSGCDQSVKVLPDRSEVFSELAATLKKC